jgi:hypothetical protein
MTAGPHAVEGQKTLKPVAAKGNPGYVRASRLERRELMKLLVAGLAFTLTMAPSARAEELSKADREKAIKYMETTKQAVIDATKPLTKAQWTFKEADDRWSVADVVEHLAASEDKFLAVVSEKVMKAPPRPAGDDVKALDEAIVAKVPDRTKKVQAPEDVRPTNRYGSPEAALKHFVESRGKTIAFLRKTDGLRDHAIDGPFGKKLDAYQWLLFCAAHSERHTKQINEVKASAKFPSA